MIPSEPELAGATWAKSTFSGGNGGECVEVAHLRGRVGVRDTKRRGQGPVLVFADAEWAAFLSGVRAGEFEHG